MHTKWIGQTFFLRHESQACWTCRRFSGNPSSSEATNLTGRFEAEVAEGSKFCCGSIRSIQNWQYVDVRRTKQTRRWINTAAAAATFNLAGSLGLDSGGSWDTRQVLVLHVSVKTRRWMRGGPRCRSSVWYLHKHTRGLGRSSRRPVSGHCKPPFLQSPLSTRLPINTTRAMETTTSEEALV